MNVNIHMYGSISDGMGVLLAMVSLQEIIPPPPPPAHNPLPAVETG